VSRSHRSSAGSGTLSDSGFGLNVDEDAMGMVDWRRRRVTTDEREGKGIDNGERVGWAWTRLSCTWGAAVCVCWAGPFCADGLRNASQDVSKKEREMEEKRQ
jgi:hypothetical protein